ncbi:thioredoxin-dependent thiol peroxidase [Agromyces silvae]|uniref:thioredoxin-dependent thiol peroxidase n=1 Tax=Agromyces silvae TaxID=3388266 RepID=UPI00280A9B8C|nr:thioredoxin-dependent thiol peroxidase [Agromyces protaetiae]
MTEARLAAGDLAPDFTLTDQQGSPVTLSDLRGSKVVLYFYPEAMTPGCTTEACDFRDNLNSFAAAGVTVLGVSKDDVDKLRRFAERDRLTFTLLSDPDLAVQQAYGVWGEKSLYGKTVVGSIRSTFILDEDGRVEKAMYNVKATGHVARLRRELGLD